MLEKIVMKATVVSVCAAIVTLCGYMIHMMIQDARVDRRMSKVIDQRLRDSEARNEKLNKMVKDFEEKYGKEQ